MNNRKMLAMALAGVVSLLGAGPFILAVAPGGWGAQTAAQMEGPVPAAPVPAEPGVLHATAAGDYSSSSAAAGVLSGMAAAAPDVNFALGDLSYGATGAEQSWCDFVTARMGAGFPFQLLAGNHESNGQNGNINDFSACLPNQLPGLVGTYGRQYYVDVPQQNPLVRFVMISPGIPFTAGAVNFSAGSPNYNWTSSAIDGARAAAIPWVVVGMHMPCLSMGQYDCSSITAVTNLLLEKKVDLVLNGHEHLYQRSKQLATSAGCQGLATNNYNPACVADGDNTLAKGAGTVFSTVGTGGVALRNINTTDPEAPYFNAWSGLNIDPSHGFMDLRFTATSLTAAYKATSGTFQDGFNIAPAGENAPPAAAFTNSCNALACSFDGTGSADPDGSIASYAWGFGDSTSAATATANKTYAAAGTYPVTLTVTDTGGATHSTTRNITVANGVAAMAEDTFTRTLAGGLGTANVGGPWSTTGSAGDYFVAAGTGRMRIPAAGTGRNAYLMAVSSTAAETYLEFATDKAISGSGLYISGIGRRISGAGEYRAKVLMAANGSVSLALVRVTAAGTETTIQSAVTIAGLNYAVGDKLALRLQVTGTAPSTIRAKVWELSATEPAGWQCSVDDSTPALQTPGGIGVATYLSSTAKNAPVVVSVDNLRAVAP